MNKTQSTSADKKHHFGGSLSPRSRTGAVSTLLQQEERKRKRDTSSDAGKSGKVAHSANHLPGESSIFHQGHSDLSIVQKLQAQKQIHRASFEKSQLSLKQKLSASNVKKPSSPIRPGKIDQIIKTNLRKAGVEKAERRKERKE